MRVAMLAVLLSGCAVQLGARALTHPMWLPEVGSSATPHADLTVTTHDRLKLSAWVFEPEGRRVGTVVLLHGKDANRQHLTAAAPQLLARGFEVVAYDQRAHGASEGTTTTYGFHEVADLRAVLDAVHAERVVLIGESMGAAVALQAAAVEPRVVGVVAGASFSDLRTIVDEKTPRFMKGELEQAAIARAEAEAGFKVDEVSPVRAAESIRVPVLLLHGLQDPYIGVDHSRRILEHLGPNGHLVLLDGVGHVDVLLHDEAWKRIGRWMDDEVLQPSARWASQPRPISAMTSEASLASAG
jgi:pimeloyl-ACP methyl ester carboxylesterase